MKRSSLPPSVCRCLRQEFLPESQNWCQTKLFCVASGEGNLNVNEANKGFFLPVKHSKRQTFRLFFKKTLHLFLWSVNFTFFVFVVTVVTFSFIVLCLFQLLLTKTVRHSTKSTNTLCSDLTIVLQIEKKNQTYFMNRTSSCLMTLTVLVIK